MKFRVWRFFFDFGKRRFHSTRFGGHAVRYRGRSVTAGHLLGPIYFIPDWALHNVGLLKQSGTDIKA